MSSRLTTDRAAEQLAESTRLHDKHWHAGEAETVAALQHTPLATHTHGQLQLMPYSC